jgi:hypothetical protein
LRGFAQNAKNAMAIIIRFAHPQGRLPLVLARRYCVREQCLGQIGDVVVVSEFKELYPPSSIFSSSLAALPD